MASGSQQSFAEPPKSAKTGPRILQLKITLKNCTPKIWRRILVADTDTFESLHHNIQGVMGWRSYHLHEFITKSKIRIVDRDDEDDIFSFADRKVKDHETSLSKFLKNPKDSVTYVYDFGDGWTHQVLLEKVLPYDDNISYPKLVTGKRACPPEDCGGPWGFKQLMEIRADPSHEEYKEKITEWLDDLYPDYDPDKFEAPFFF